MESVFKKAIEKIKTHAIAKLTTALIICAIFVAAAVVLGLKVHRTAMYVCLVPALLALVYIIYLVAFNFKHIKSDAITIANKYELTNNLVHDFGFRTFVISCGSFVINLWYVVYNGAIASYYFSLWYAILAVYYLSLCLIRGGIMVSSGKIKKFERVDKNQSNLRKIKSSIRCGIYLNLLAWLIVGGIVRLILAKANSYRSFTLLYVAVAYALIRICLAVHNIIKAKRSNDLTTRCLRTISFADALVSLYTIQTVVIEIYGITIMQNRIAMAASGGAVCITIALLGTLIAIDGKNQLKKLQAEGLDAKGY